MKPIISFQNFSFKYKSLKQDTLKNINLDIFENEMVLILGPSGCGKSTLASCINGLIPHSYKGEIKGKVIVDDRDIKMSSIFDISNHVATILQDSDAQFIGLTCKEDIAFYLENNCIDQPTMKSKVIECSNKIGISDLLDLKPQTLSGGQKQRVCIAGSIINDAKILLFDEPLASLDPKTSKNVIELISKLHKDYNHTTIIIEHRLEDVLHCKVDKIVVMESGEIVGIYKPEELLTSNILENIGIRLPFNISCLKYAGSKLDSNIKFDSIENYPISENDISNILNWYKKNIYIQSNNLSKTLLKVENLTFGYREDITVLKNINLEIRQGEMISLVGKNGQGKSTLAKVICGFESANSGKIYFKDEDITDYSITSRFKHIGLVLQNPNQMISQQMIFDEVALGILDLGLSKSEIEDKVYNVLKICGLYKYRNWPINALSYGQKKRVTIASILIMQPSIIILDEPTAGQDYKHYSEIMKFLNKLNKLGITIIMISHDMHLILEYSNRCIVLNKGEIIMDDSPYNVLQNKDIINKSSLVQTTLFDVANKVNVVDKANFVKSFIEYEKGLIDES